MAKFQDCTFENSTVVLDGNEHIKCKFINSRIIITRGNFTLDQCSFDGCNFEFGGEAANIRNIVLGLINQPSSSKPQAEKNSGVASNE
jgi:hypothetical protein